MKAIFGEMEFGDFVVSGNPSPICIVHRVQAVMDLPNEDAADALLTQYDSYVIPDLTNREIVYALNAWNDITN
jgi:hypothetical protein